MDRVMSSVEERWLGVASATLGTMRLAGQMLRVQVTLVCLLPLPQGDSSAEAAECSA